MTILHLRHIPGSRSVRILWLLEEVGCDYRLEIMKEDRSLYDVLCPVARVPALRDGEVTMHETGAMTEWICETRSPHLGRSPDSAGRAGWLDWLHFGETLLTHVIAARFRNPVPSPTASSSDEMIRLEHGFDLLEDWLGESNWLLSDFSGVDCHVGYSLWIASQVMELDPYPVLQAFLTRCSTRKAFQRASLLTGGTWK